MYNVKTTILTTLAAMMIAVAAFGQERERVIKFHADIVIDTTGTVTVTEHIKVFAAGDIIQRGIEYEIPVYNRDDRNRKRKMDFNVVSVTRDGKESPYNIQYIGDNMRIRTGSQNVLLREGEHDYTVVYSGRQGIISFFDEYDELYWNVTGYWPFPVEEASATITLPAGAKALQSHGYIGAFEESGDDYRVETRGNQYHFFTTRRLEADEEFTVAVGFTRDIIQRPPPLTPWEAFVDEYIVHLCALGVLALFLCYMLITFLTVGKRADKPVAIPTFKPPRNWSPATARLMKTLKYDNTALTATLIEMAVKGAINIRPEDNKYIIENKRNTALLTPEETKIYSAIFGSEDKDEAVIGAKNYLYKADESLKNEVTKGWKLEDYYKENVQSIAIGGILTLLLVFSYFVLERLFAWTDSGLDTWWVVLPLFIYTFYTMRKYGFKKELEMGGKITYFIVYFIAVGMWSQIDGGIDWFPSVVFYVAMVGLYLAYIRLIPTRTHLGAQVKSELDGFIMYMKTAEEHRLNILTPPEKTPELFEKLLPYAIALDVGNEWCEKFDSVLKRFNYRPAWYSSSEEFNTSRLGHNFTSFNRHIKTSAAAANRALKAASRSASSSGSYGGRSGSRGGGYSGGGRGGGRRGGW